ncbi:MAG: uroporphyrinogen decarboxylase family protein [Armatimonadota bacterium]|nr:uroporphyrinogen decarboxylase family protein [Armatimonadota bacterium]
MTPWERFVTVARGGHVDRIPVALIVDSPWLPGYAGIDTLDYFLDPDQWLRINLGLLDRFPDVVWIPGFWVEFGMAAEPSAFGARVVWHHTRPPSIEPLPGGLAALAAMEPPDPQRHGLMPLVLQRYADAECRLAARGLGVRVVASRGPFAVAAWLLGMSEFLIALKVDPETSARALEVVTQTIMAWIRAQLAVLRAPEGILLLDDMVGLLSPALFERFARTCLSRIFDEFRGLIRIFHNDTPCPHLLGPMATLGFDVFNFSHALDMAVVREQVPATTLMGNVPPLDVMARGTPADVVAWARECIGKTGGRRLILSAGGGVSPGTPPESIDALVEAARLHYLPPAEG